VHPLRGSHHVADMRGSLTGVFVRFGSARFGQPFDNNFHKLLPAIAILITESGAGLSLSLWVTELATINLQLGARSVDSKSKAALEKWTQSKATHFPIPTISRPDLYLHLYLFSTGGDAASIYIYFWEICGEKWVAHSQQRPLSTVFFWVSSVSRRNRNRTEKLAGQTRY